MSLFTVITRDNAYQLPATKLIVGLGNVGPEYVRSRHNLGFMAVEAFQSECDLPPFTMKNELSSLLSEGKIEDTKVLVAKPTTLMNRSGLAVLKLQNYFELGIDQILIIHDDIDLMFGDIRTKIGGSSGGHNGIKSVDSTIGEDYARIRIGIADEHRGKHDTSDYVLKDIPKAQLAQLDGLFDESNGLIMQFIDGKFA